MSEIDEIRKNIVGMKLSDAKWEASVWGWCIRVVYRDGSGGMVTQDYKPNRVNVATHGGIVSEVVSIG